MKGKISLEVLKHRLNAPQGFRDISTANAGRPWPVRPRPSSRGLNAPQGFRDISTVLEVNVETPPARPREGVLMPRRALGIFPRRRG